MPAYRIEIASTGAELVTLMANSERDALDVMARYAGYADFADAVSIGDFADVDLRLTQLHYSVQAFNPGGFVTVNTSALYGDCPAGFSSRQEAAEWAERLASVMKWSQGNPSYRVARIEG